MSETKTPHVIELMAEVGKAFIAHDAAGIAAHFAEDGVFINAVGDLAGDTYTGPEQVRGYFEKVFAESPDVVWKARAAPLVISDTQAVTQWHRTATGPDGVRKQWFGVDIYEFRGRQVIKKDTYIKAVITG